VDRSDEESKNSSENSFNELVTAALAGGYAMSMMMVPPQVNPDYHQPDLNGRQWVANILEILADALSAFVCSLIISVGCITY
jgi:hypothetical protein